MQLHDFFFRTNGIGVLSTADNHGRVDAAIYAKPHVMTDGSIALIMRDRLTYHNLKTNPYAAYLFIADGGSYRGVRLFLEKIKEDSDPVLIAKMTRRHLSVEEDEAKGPKFVVYFKVEKTLALIGDGDAALI